MDDEDEDEDDERLELPKNCKARIEVNVFDEGAYCTLYDSEGTPSEYAFGKTVVRFLVQTINAGLDESLCLQGKDIRIILESKK